MMTQVYNGDLPYIFISYAHKDSDRVIPAIEAMQRKGYRVWYDCGVEAGTEWANNIAAHLHNCAAFAAFISDNSMASEHCLDEIAFAKKNLKPSLMIFLEENVTVPLGTDMNTARFQRMFFNRQTSVEAFVENLGTTPVFAPCIGEVSADTTPPIGTTPPEQPRPNKLPLIIGWAVAAIAVIVLSIVLFAGGSDNKPSDDPSDAATTTTAPADVQMSDNLMDCTFEMDGTVYKLPFDFSQLTDNGWAIIANDVTASTDIQALSYVVFSMEKNDRSIRVNAYNDTGNVLSVAESKISMIEVQAEEASGFRFTKDISPASSREDIIAAFGEPDKCDEKQNYELLTYTDKQYPQSSVTFKCYYEDNSLSIALKCTPDYRYTETNTAVPAYLADYRAPAALGDDLFSGTVLIEGVLYQLPAPLQVFLDNGWTLDTEFEYLVAGAVENVTLKKDGKKLSVNVKNFADYQTLPENCAAIALTFHDTARTEPELPGGIRFGMTLAEIEKALPASMERSDGEHATTFRYNAANDRGFTLTVSVRADGTVQTVYLNRTVWDYE
ncbi:MAG: toll/interleukin-1 receptor domain-containing protein [Ruminococcaceae bacterium]|nr:toll/interleukin-1 receptor domain-containing protein [Oscillospiraceae bacterium]